MSDTAISIENLSKAYRLGTVGGRTFREDTARWWAKQRGKPDPYLRIGQESYANQEGELVWALRDINLQVRQGEILGIIGRNGAGKSTLLKILSRITAPTEGVVKVRGRIGSLLEVGTGFHPELTGRENVFLNGAILGMTRAEVASKFDEIVAFSGVEQYIDTPVKRYSSGMHVRLAFAVAAHLEPEILVIDEVLAVGDAEFRQKSVGKMGQVAREGRTVLFVSHNMGAIESICTSCVLIEGGRIKTQSSDVPGVIGAYHDSALWVDELDMDEIDFANNTLRLHSFTAESDRSPEGSQRAFTKADKIRLRMAIEVFSTDPDLAIGYGIYNSANHCLWWSFDVDSNEEMSKHGLREYSTEIPAELLNDGSYRVELLASFHHRGWVVAPNSGGPSLRLEVRGGTIGTANTSSTTRPGMLFPVLNWDVEPVNSAQSTNAETPANS